MSQKEAQRFISDLGTDWELRNRLKSFIEKEGYICTVNEFRRAEWNELIKCNNSDANHHESVNLSGYEHWVG
ncbi:MAG: hypothetical protein WCG19_04860 [Chlorobiaceae bacterium]